MQDFFRRQFENKFLWLPFFMAAGATAYFMISTEPNALACYTGLIICIISIFIHKHVWLQAIFTMIFGFCYAATFTNLINTPKLSRDIRDINITGIITDIDYTNTTPKLYLTIPTNDIFTNDKTASVRLSISNDQTIPNIGDIINTNVALFRPDIPDVPNGFDFARWAYFNNLTATGYIKSYETIKKSNTHNIKILRAYIHNRANSFLTDGLILGYKNAINKNDKSIWTTAGIGHVWSISGFHITLISGWLYVIFYTIFRIFPQITRRIPAKIPATLCTGIGLIFYLILSGSAVATIRAFLMTILIFSAVIFGRHAISIRNICIAFCILFLINPYNVMQVGFQLSFSAIFGLTWLWTDVNPKMPENKILKIIYAALLTATVATIFTAPFVISHFHTFPIYGILGNLILLPIFSVAIMPLVTLGTIAAIYGWMAPLNIAHNIYQHTLLLAQHIGNFPASNLIVPDIPNIAMFFIITGFICIMLLQTKRQINRYMIAAISIIIGIIITITSPRPVFFITTDHELVGFVENGKISFNHARNSHHKSAFDTWRQISGEINDGKNKRHTAQNGIHTYSNDNFKLVYIQKFVPLLKNIESLCNDKTLQYIVSYFDIYAPQCHAKILYDGFTIAPNGTIKYIISHRRWHNQPK